MTVISLTKARENLYSLVNQVNENGSPVTLTNSHGKNAVLLSEDDWNAIQETLYLQSVPGLAEVIRAGMKEPLEEAVPYDPSKEW